MRGSQQLEVKQHMITLVMVIQMATGVMEYPHQEEN